MPICPGRVVSPSLVRDSLAAGQPPRFCARIVWGDRPSVSNHQEGPQCRPEELDDDPGKGRRDGDVQRMTDGGCEQCRIEVAAAVRERISSLVTNSKSVLHRLPACLAGVKAGHVHLCRMAGNPGDFIWQVMLCRSVMGSHEEL